MWNSSINWIVEQTNRSIHSKDCSNCNWLQYDCGQLFTIIIYILMSKENREKHLPHYAVFQFTSLNLFTIIIHLPLDMSPNWCIPTVTNERIYFARFSSPCGKKWTYCDFSWLQLIKFTFLSEENHTLSQNFKLSFS